jgi:penicillin-binding protein A
MMAGQPPQLNFTQAPRPSRRRRKSKLTRRLLPIVALAVVAFGFGVYEASGSPGDGRAVVARYVTAWDHGNDAAMYALLSPHSKRAMSERAFATKLAKAADTATVRSLHAGKVLSVSGTQAQVQYAVHTNIFGTLHETLTLALDSSDSDHVKVVFNNTAQFPGLRAGETLSRKVLLAKRGTLLADNGQTLEAGSSLSTPMPTVAAQIGGTLEPIPAAQKAKYEREGYPADAKVGDDGLEAVFEKQLAGKIGGELYAGKRLLAKTNPVNGQTVKTTIDPNMENVASNAISGHLAGITVMRPNGQIMAASGIAYSDVQPPGSTFKIITSTAALQDGLTSLGKVYPMESSADLGGYVMHNAGGEVCGGTLINAFATSCNSTFAPIGIQLGGKRLVDEALKYGFDKPYPGIPTASVSQIPSVANIGSTASVGESAIGQGKVEASTLTMADVAATIADAGKRPLPTFDAATKASYLPVTTSTVAGDIQKMMIAVVDYGTGTTAQIPGVEVAGKTGTAELSDTGTQENDTKATDSWFVAYAPATDPKVIVAALFPNSGYGAAVAAPAVKSVIETALGIS